MGNTGKLTGAACIVNERLRQLNDEGFTPDRDDGYTASQLPYAAVAMILAAVDHHPCNTIDDMWPKDWAYWWLNKTDDPRRLLVKAGALIAAEIDRLDRMGG